MSIPLHPAVVHFPVVLAMLLPVVALAAALVVRRGGDARKTWLPVVIVAAGLAVSSFVAVRTGQAEEDTVEAVVPESAIHEHEERAELFFPLTVALLVVTAAGLASGQVATVARWTSVGAALAVAGVGFAVGHSGGELVYVHNAGAAYVSGADQGGVMSQGDADEGRHDDDSDDDSSQRP